MTATATASNGAPQVNGGAVRNRKSGKLSKLGGQSRSTNGMAAPGSVGVPTILQSKDIEAIYARVNGKKSDGKPLHASPYLALIGEVKSLQCTDTLPTEILNLCRQAAGKAVVAVAVEALTKSVNVRVKTAWKWSSRGVTRNSPEIYRGVTVNGDEPCQDQAEETKGIADIQAGFQSRAGKASDIVKLAVESGRFDYAMRVTVQDGVKDLLTEHAKFADYCRLLGKPVEPLKFEGAIEDLIVPTVRAYLSV